MNEMKMEIAEAYEDKIKVQGFKTMVKTILMVKLVVAKHRGVVRLSEISNQH